MSLFIYVEYKKKYISAVIFKGLASLSFLGCGLYNFFNNQSRNEIALLILVGLILGVFGDIFLNLRFVVKKKISNPIFLVGVFAFLAGHILYLVSTVKIIQTNNAINANLIYAPLIAAAVVSATICFLIFKLLDVKLANKIVGVLYIVTITVFVSLAGFIYFDSLTASTSNNFYLTLFIGSLLFMASDVIMIFNSFGKNPKLRFRIANLSLYYIGQLLIAISLILL